MNHILALAACIFAFTTVLSAQNLNLLGAGARSEGVGGAFIGVADDATALVWNPAGLSQLSEAEATVVARYLTDQFDYADDRPSGVRKGYSHGLFNFGSAILPIRWGSTNLILAAAYQRQLDLSSKVEPFYNYFDASGGVDSFTPGFGVAIDSVLSIGAAANIWMGRSETVWDYNSMQFSERKLRYHGVNFVAGGLIDLRRLERPLPLTLGFCIRTPFNLKGRGTEPKWGSWTNTYPVDQTMEMPLMLGVGASVRPLKDLRISGDYEIRSYGNRNIHVESPGSWSYSDPLSAYDLNEYRIGAEYVIADETVAIPVRVGYRSFPTTFENYDTRGSSTGQVIGHVLSFGSGLAFRRIAFDAAYTMASYIIHMGAYASITYSTGTLSASLTVKM